MRCCSVPLWEIRAPQSVVFTEISPVAGFYHAHAMRRMAPSAALHSRGISWHPVCLKTGMVLFITREAFLQGGGLCE